jgi:hypothetical protein
VRASTREYERPNPAASGIGAVALLFSILCLRRAVPEQQRSVLAKCFLFRIQKRLSWCL